MLLRFQGRHENVGVEGAIDQIVEGSSAGTGIHHVAESEVVSPQRSSAYITNLFHPTRCPYFQDCTNVKAIASSRYISEVGSSSFNYLTVIMDLARNLFVCKNRDNVLVTNGGVAMTARYLERYFLFS